ncbi:MAG: DUF2490 domain-containing protein [Bacteroidaceae bacterium]|nr:DUF2490 domain-containing protein [Bacteroidaceae bacterium]
MNTNLKNKFRGILTLLIAIFLLAPLYNVNAQGNNDEFGIWTTFEASKKINKKFKFVADAEFRTYDFVNNIERAAIGVKLEYKILKWLKTNIGYQFHYKHNPEEISIKDQVEDEDGNIFNEYNIDHDYWVIRNRVYATISGEHKIGRFELGWRGRLQYTHTASATTDETKYRYNLGEDPLFTTEDNRWDITTEPETKKAKHNLTFRTRLSLKYDIPNCKISPFASAELYTRLDEWKAYDKLRYRIGASYKINKDNSISLYYLFEDVNGEANGHAIGLEYSIDL